MASCEGKVGPLWQANLKLYYFLTIVDAHPAPLLVGSAIWTYTPGHWSCFVWHLSLCPYLGLASLSFPCDYDRTANLQ